MAAFAIAINPVKSNVVWTANHDGWLSRIEHNSGNNIAVSRHRLPPSAWHGHGTNLLFDLLDTNVMYVSGVMMQGIYRTIDAGLTWNVWQYVPDRRLWMSGSSVIVDTMHSSTVVTYGDVSLGMIHEYCSIPNVNRVTSFASYKSICSLIEIEVVTNRYLIAGCKGGNIEVVCPDKNVSFSVSTGCEYYSEIPKIKSRRKNCDTIYAITTGFDSLNRNHGVIASCDAGMSWQPKYQPGISYWGLDVCECGRSIVVGGFSEFSFVNGQGHIDMINTTNGVVVNLGQAIPWINGNVSSVWDIQHSTFMGSTSIYFATENGLYALR